jgi:hypothetical protein
VAAVMRTIVAPAGCFFWKKISFFILGNFIFHFLENRPVWRKRFALPRPERRYGMVDGQAPGVAAWWISIGRGCSRLKYAPFDRTPG